MRIKIKNFARIEKADIKIKPLTIFVGKNSTNKSYVAHLIYEGQKKLKERIFSYLYNYLFDTFLNDNIEHTKELKLEINEEFTKYRFTEKDLKEIFNSKIDLDKDFHIEIYFEDLKTTSLDIVDDEWQIVKDIFQKIKETKINLEEINEIKDYTLRNIFFEILFPQMILNFYPIYLPASRSGFILGFDEFIKSIITSDKPTSSFLTKPVIEFLRNLYTAKTKEKEKLTKKQKKLEEFINEKLIKGKIVERKSRYKNKEYLFRPKGSKHNLKPHLVSSSTLEIFPFVIFIRSINDLENTFFIIEEPEAHLHPEAQINMSRFLSLLANSSNTVLITTHSDYIINELSNCIRLNTLKEVYEDRFKQFLKEEELNKYPDVAINHKNVAVYLFKEENGKVVVKPVEVNEYGIEDENFEEILDELIIRSSKLGELING